MFDLDKWQEIYSTVQKNKLRTFLTGFSVAWGIFMLLILLGSGKGLENGFRQEFEEDASNGIWIYPGQTSMPYKGNKPGKYVQFKNEDYEYLKATVEEKEYISAEISVNGWGGSPIAYKNESGTYSIKGVHPQHKFIEFRDIIDGRFINEQDLKEFRKVTAVGQTLRDELFGDIDPIGEYVTINGIAFKVVGVFKEELGQNQRGRIYIPISTGQKAFGMYSKVNEIMLTSSVSTIEESMKLADQLRTKMAKRHDFDPNDPRAIYINNNLEDYKMFQDIFGGIRTFIWIIGIGTIIAGIVGIGNIMTVVVKERTKEIGIRKALGATPGSILSLIIQESTVITAFFGYTGLVLGIGLMELVNSVIPPNDMFQDPTIDFNIAILCTIMLIVSGIVAGLIPAYKAANIKPIVAMRDE